MRQYFDTEFLEDGVTIDFISIGIVNEKDEEYYAISNEFDEERAKKHPFVSEYVLPHLEGKPRKSRKVIAKEIIEFVGENPEFWASYCSYDWVVLCQLYGAMIDLPDGWDKYCNDIQQFKKFVEIEKFHTLNNDEHDALADAREVKTRYEICEKKLKEMIKNE